MNAMREIFEVVMFQRVGWALVHFTWQAGGVAALLAGGLLLLRRRSASERYLLACCALALMAALPVVTFWLISPQPTEVLSAGPALLPAPQALPAKTYDSPGRTLVLKTITPAPQPPWQERLSGAVRPVLPYVVQVWLGGVVLLSAWRGTGWSRVRQLKRSAAEPIGRGLAEVFAALARRLGVSRTVRLMRSSLVKVPVVVGWFKPVVLLPVSAITGLSADQLRAVLAHELAHIRRYDHLVNLVQTIIETLLFYHPAVWWVSGRIRRERENCCDDMAIRSCGRPAAYAKALVAMEQLRQGPAGLVLAASGGSLLGRIRRLLAPPANQSSRPTRWAGGVITLLTVLAICLGAHISCKGRKQSPARGKGQTTSSPAAASPAKKIEPTVIKGVVKDQEGRPVEGIDICLPPGSSRSVRTNSDGRFQLALDPSVLRNDRSIRSYAFARDLTRNLASAVEIEQPDTPLDIKLQQGVTISGRVIDPEHKPIANARVSLSIRSPEGVKWDNAWFSHNRAMTDTRGNYAIKALPCGFEYIATAGAQDYGRDETELDLRDVDRYRLDVDDLTLRRANMSISGVVLGPDENPVPGATIFSEGPRQPYRRTITDEAGRFTIRGICQGMISLNASDDKGQIIGSDDCPGGGQNVEIYVRQRGACLLPPKSPPQPLLGRELPKLSDLGVNLHPASVEGKRILVCFWRMSEAPSRQCVRQLASRTKELTAKDIVVVAVQDRPRNEKHLRKWLAKNHIPFQVGMLADASRQIPEQRVIHCWSVREIPWLILTDEDHVVRAEGFDLNELDEKLERTPGN